jgi:hypothetical protein
VCVCFHVGRITQKLSGANSRKIRIRGFESYTRRVLGVAYFRWEFCWANKPNGSAVMIHTLLRIDIELRMR